LARVDFSTSMKGVEFVVRGFNLSLKHGRLVGEGLNVSPRRLKMYFPTPRIDLSHATVCRCDRTTN
jgi:hypothetical protein